MSGDDAVLRDRRVGLLTRFPIPFRSTSPPHRPCGRSAVGPQARLPGLLLAWDWLGIGAIGLLIDIAMQPHGAVRTTHCLDIVLGATAAVNFLHFIRGYCVRGLRRAGVQMVKTSVAWTAAFVSLLAVRSLADSVLAGPFPAGSLPADPPLAFPGGWSVIWFAAVWTFLWVTRFAVGSLLLRWRREGRLARNLAVLGSGAAAAALARRLQARSDEANVVGVFDDGGARIDLDGRPVEGEPLAALIEARQVDEVILALPYGSTEAVRQQLAILDATPVEVKVDPGLTGLGASVQGYHLVAGIPVLTLQGEPLAGWGAPFKRAEDVVLTSILLVLMAPALLLIAVLIKLDSPGPVIFRQERNGFNNERIVVFKFRTMHHQPEPDPDAPQARPNDPRVTRLGAFLRRTSLDELPQLINVLRGDMSLVGPRPHAVAHNEKYGQLIDHYLARHRMKPGLTGWAQVNGWRGETDTLDKMQGRLKHDLYYIANWSPLLDVKVLLLTVPVAIRGANAY